MTFATGRVPRTGPQHHSPQETGAEHSSGRGSAPSITQLNLCPLTATQMKGLIKRWLENRDVCFCCLHS